MSDRYVFSYVRKNPNGRPILVTETNLHTKKQWKNRKIIILVFLLQVLIIFDYNICSLFV